MATASPSRLPSPAAAPTAQPAASPLATLRELATALEAALTACLADPDPRAVHTLRALIRRLHAQLALLAPPPSSKAAAKALRRLHRLSALAGKVRDLDVQRSMLDDLTQRPAPHTGDLEPLHRRLKKRRKLAAAKLQTQLEKHIAPIAHGLEALLDTSKTLPNAELPTRNTLETIAAAFAAACANSSASDAEDQLHTLRKAAKTARYQAESLPGSAPSTRAAARYRRIQNAGGLWHDRLTFAALLAKDLKPGHGLITRSNRNVATARKAYERLLTQHSFTPPAPAPSDYGTGSSPPFANG